MTSEKKILHPNQIRELKSFLVERYVDNMSTKDLVAYVMTILTDIMKICQMQNLLMKQKLLLGRSLFDEVDII